MQLQFKHVNDAPAQEDGARVLVDRLWPRGHSKEQLHPDLWLEQIAPSDALRKWFNHEPEKWPEFRQLYARGLDANPESAQLLQDQLREHGTVTLLFGTHERRYNNAVALCAYMRPHLPRIRGAAS